MSYVIEDCKACVPCSETLELTEIAAGVCESFRMNPPERLFFANTQGTALTLATFSEVILQGRLDGTGVEKIVATPPVNYAPQLGPAVFSPNALVTETTSITQAPTILGVDNTSNVVIPFLLLSKAQRADLYTIFNCPTWNGNLAFFWTDILGNFYFSEKGVIASETMQGFWVSSQGMTTLSAESLAGGYGSQKNEATMYFKEKEWDCGMNAIPAPYARTIEKTPPI